MPMSNKSTRAGLPAASLWVSRAVPQAVRRVEVDGDNQNG